MARPTPEPEPPKRRQVKPHDAFFKAVFEQPENAAALLREALPAKISAAIAWQTLAPQSGTYIDPELADHHSDLLFSVELDGEQALLYVLLEHQSTNHGRMPLRMLHYSTQVWLRYCRRDGKQHAVDAPMPVLLSLVITHARGGWIGPRTFFELLQPDPTKIAGLASLVPSFELTLLDLAHLSNEELRDRALDAFCKLALWLLRDARDADRLFENLEFWTATFRQALATPRGIEAVALLLRYIAHVCTSLQFEDFRERIRQQLPEAEQATMTAAEQFHQEGLEEGLQKGREEGREEGLRMALQKLLTVKFGAPLAEYRARLETATAEELDRYIERVLIAPTLAAVFTTAS